MIYVTEGHELGIGLEIFLKSFLLLSKEEKKCITLVSSRNDLLKNFSDNRLSPQLFKDLQILENENITQFSSTNALLTALKKTTEKDILVTLPTSKDQLVLNGVHKAGYTEFFRTYFSNPNLTMTFKGIDHNVLLITDHIPLKDVSSQINSSIIEKKMALTIDNFKKYFYEFNEVIISGINPHAGENGILGQEDFEIEKAITNLEKSYGKIFRGPYSGDTLHHYVDNSKKQLFVYMFHDQGLAPFKSQYGLVGLNITLGLPFLRMSVDHGTAFELYGKNKANISGMLFLLKNCFEVNSVINK